MPDDLKSDLARDVRFALRLKVVNREARKAIRSLSEKAVDWMADDIAAYLLLAGWHHRPRSETDFSGPGFMSGMRPRPTPSEGEPEKDGQE